MTRIVRLATLASIVLGTPGCRGQEPEEWPVEAPRTAYEELATAGQTDGQDFQDPGGVGVMTVQGDPMGPITATGNLRGRTADSPSPGAITITDSNGQTTVLLTLSGYEAGTIGTITIARGVCAQPGSIVHQHPDRLQVPREGILNHEVTVPLPIQTFLDGNHSFRVVGDAPGVGSPDLGCADLPALPATP